MNNNVKEIRIYKNAVVYNSHHDRDYLTKKYMEIEFFNNKIIKLDLDANADITECNYLIIKDKGKIIKMIFKSNLL